MLPRGSTDVRTLSVAESISIKTVLKPVSTVIQPTTVTWHQNVIQTVTSTIIWHVFDVTTGTFLSLLFQSNRSLTIPSLFAVSNAAPTATASLVRRSGAKRVASWE